MRALPTLAGLVSLLLFSIAQAAGASAADLAQCAAVSAAEARLACYDALAHRGAGPAATSQSAAGPAASTPPAVRTTPPAPPSTAAVSSPTVVPAPDAVSLDDPKNFGLSLNQLQRGQSKAPTTGLKSVTARITSMAPAGMGRSRIVLDNDQTWDVLDDDGAISSGLEVTIRKATLGSFLMSAAHHKYRVHRVR